eukprot:m.75916 g.75916  ORF g.75916 m.75916 type:complete len:997 (-) comp14409_c0_seq1:101-3091(-)
MTSASESVAGLTSSELNIGHTKNTHSSISIQIQDTIEDHDEDCIPTRHDNDVELEHFLRPSDAEEPMPATNLGSAEQAISHIYDIGRMLGMGTHGEVKQATHKLTKQEVAIKFIAKDECPEDKAAWSEVAALKKIRHPHVVRLYDVIHTEDTVMLVLECLGGGELFDYLVSRRRLSETEGRRFVRQILSALEFCHNQNVVHRDLKLENLLLGSDDQVKITDFGFSNLFKEGGLMSTFVGSPAYAAPEILANEKYIGPNADIWSLGVIIFTILTGEMPFKDDNVLTNLKKIQNAEYDLPDFLSDHAQDLLSHLLVRDPSQRMSISDMWEHPWIADGHPGPYRCQLTDEVAEDVHTRCLARLKGEGLDIAQLQADLRSNAMTRDTASYHLMQDALLEEDKQHQAEDEIKRLIAALPTPTGGTRSPFLFGSPQPGPSMARARAGTVSAAPAYGLHVLDASNDVFSTNRRGSFQNVASASVSATPRHARPRGRHSMATSQPSSPRRRRVSILGETVQVLNQPRLSPHTMAEEPNHSGLSSRSNSYGTPPESPDKPAVAKAGVAALASQSSHPVIQALGSNSSLRAARSRSPTRAPHPLSRGSSTMNSQASLFSPSEDTSRHRGSLLAREASVSSSPVKNMECSVGEGSKRPSSTEEGLSETNADALERLRNLRRTRRASRASSTWLGSDLEGTVSSGRRASTYKVTLLHQTTETMLATELPSVVRRLSRNSSLNGVSRRSSRMSRRTSSNTSQRGSRGSNDDRDSISMATTPTSLLDVSVEEEVFSRSGSARRASSKPALAVVQSQLEAAASTVSQDSLGVFVASPMATATRAPKSPSNPTSPLMTRHRPDSRRRSASVSTAALRSPRGPVAPQPRKVDVNALDLAAANAVSSSSFGAATTSTLPYDQLISELERVLSKNGHMYKLDKNVFECHSLPDTSQQRSRRRSSYASGDGNAVVWEMAVQVISKLGLHGIRLRRLQGDHWKYKQLVDNLLKDARI